MQQVIKRLILCFLIGWGVGWEAYAQLQPLKINIQLPAGVGLSSGNPTGSASGNGNGSTNGKESGSEKGKEAKGKDKDSKAEGGEGPIKGSTSLVEDQVEFALVSETGQLVPLSWIRMQSMENSQFLVDFRDGNGKTLSVACYFLNNSTDELQDAMKISAFPALLQFNEEGRLIRNFSPRRTSLYSWIGIPNDPGVVTVIEYF